MQDELFQVEESISPMREWTQMWCIQVHRDEARKISIATRGSLSFLGLTEEEALSKLAKHLRIKLWDE